MKQTAANARRGGGWSIQDLPPLIVRSGKRIAQLGVSQQESKPKPLLKARIYKCNVLKRTALHWLRAGRPPLIKRASFTPPALARDRPTIIAGAGSTEKA